MKTVNINETKKAYVDSQRILLSIHSQETKRVFTLVN